MEKVKYLLVGGVHNSLEMGIVCPEFDPIKQNFLELLQPKQLRKVRNNFCCGDKKCPCSKLGGITAVRAVNPNTKKADVINLLKSKYPECEFYYSLDIIVGKPFTNRWGTRTESAFDREVSKLDKWSSTHAKASTNFSVRLTFNRKGFTYMQEGHDQLDLNLVVDITKPELTHKQTTKLINIVGECIDFIQSFCGNNDFDPSI